MKTCNFFIHILQDCFPGTDYKNPLHLYVIDRYLRRMEDKTIPDEAPPSLESFYPPWVADIDLPQSRCCGFFVSFTNKQIKVYFKVKTQEHRRFVGCLIVVVHIRKWCFIACVVMVMSWRLFVMRNKACHPLRLKPCRYKQNIKHSCTLVDLWRLYVWDSLLCVFICP